MDSADTNSVPSTSMAVAFPTQLASRDIDRHILAVRSARAAAGIVLVAGAVVLVVTTIARALAHTPAADSMPFHARAVLFGTWLAAAGVAAATYGARRLAFRAVDPGRADDRGLVASLSWPLAGLGLLLPLTLHAFVGLGVNNHDFDGWVAMSCALVGHCHVALALMGARRAERLVKNHSSLRPIVIYAVVVGLAMVPGAVFLLIPPIIVAATGLPFIGLLWLPQLIIANERHALWRQPQAANSPAGAGTADVAIGPHGQPIFVAD